MYIYFSRRNTFLWKNPLLFQLSYLRLETVLITQNSHTKFHEQFTQTITLGHHDEENLGKYKLLFFMTY